MLSMHPTLELVITTLDHTNNNATFYIIEYRIIVYCPVPPSNSLLFSKNFAISTSKSLFQKFENISKTTYAKFL